MKHEIFMFLSFSRTILFGLVHRRWTVMSEQPGFKFKICLGQRVYIPAKPT